MSRKLRQNLAPRPPDGKPDRASWPPSFPSSSARAWRCASARTCRPLRLSASLPLRRTAALRHPWLRLRPPSPQSLPARDRGASGHCSGIPVDGARRWRSPAAAGPDAQRLVLRTQPRSVNTAGHPATIAGPGCAPPTGDYAWRPTNVFMVRPASQAQKTSAAPSGEIGQPRGRIRARPVGWRAVGLR